MPLPDFLIIGAMKAATTTLYHDLLANSEVFFPFEKEPSNLIYESVLTVSGRREYAALFRKARPHQICGETSTAYSKLPLYAGVPLRARDVLGKSLKVIYLVREPVSRSISHHQHQIANGVYAEQSLDQALIDHPNVLDFSRYAMQIEPWIETFGPDHIRIVIFEDYIQRRMETIEDLSLFLGITPCPESIDPTKSYNRGDSRTVKSGFFGRMSKTLLYRAVIRPLLPMRTRYLIRDALLPTAHPLRETPSLGCIERMIKVLAPEAERLGHLMGHDGSPWDFGEVRRSYAEAKASADKFDHEPEDKTDMRTEQDAGT